MQTRTISFATAAALAGVVLSAATAHADFVAPDWARPADAAQATTDGTTYQAYDVFTGLTDQSPDVVDVNPTGSADLDELTGMAFVTSGGNIYSPTFATEFSVALPGIEDASADGTNFHLQFRTLGSVLDISSVLIDGVPVTSLPGDGYTQLDRVPLGGFGGEQVDHLFEFFVDATASSFTLDFDAAGSSMSLDQLSIDTLVGVNVVPEPAGLLALAGAGLLTLRRRRA